MALRATIDGRVQGVGFREATRRRALELGLSGWVRNRSDGAVELHAEGPAAALAQLREFLQSGPPAADVTAVHPSDRPDEGLGGFEIR